MKLLLITVLVGAAVATVEEVKPADPVEVVAGIPGIKAFQYTHPGFVQKYEVKQFVNGPLTYSVKSAVPTKFTAPTIKAVGFKPLFTGFEGPDALFTTTDVEEETTAEERAEEAAEETAEEPIADTYSADSTVDAVETEVVEPEFPVVPTYFVPNYGFAPSVYSVAGANQVFTGSNRVYASPTVYSSPSVYSSPFFYHNQGIAPAMTNLLTSPQHVASYVYRTEKKTDEEA